MKNFKSMFVLLLTVALFNTACDRPINIFTVNQDMELGAELEKEIEANPTEYPLLSETSYPAAYAYLYAMRDVILSSPEIKFKDKFLWKLKIIDGNELNAFCAPGGYIYVYTGLMKYLEKVDHLAGVLAHEIAHADQRHSTAAMTEQFGLELLIAVASRNATAAQLSQVAGSLTSLAFSRAHETDADEHSVDYLSSTVGSIQYACNGAAGFFVKLEAAGGSSTPAFLSTHPDPDNRITKINDRSTELSCSTALYHDNGDAGAYATMVATLP